MLAPISAPPIPLSDAVDALGCERIDGLTDSALEEDLVDIRRQIDRLEGEFLRRLHRFDRSHAALADGAVSTVSWLRTRCAITGGLSAQRVRMARVLAELPSASASLCAGRASFSNVALISQLAEDVGTASVRTVEGPLVTAAEQLDAGRMRHLALVTRMRLDADGALDQEARNHERRWFACDQTYGGVFIVRGELDAEAAPCSPPPSPRSPLRAASRTPGPARSAVPMRSSTSLPASSRAGWPAPHGPRPQLTLTTSLDALQGVAGAEPAELSGVGPVHAETARRLACDAVRTVVTVAPAADPSAIGVPAAELQPLSVGRATRTIPAHLRTALVVRDKGCRFPGCDRPPEWTDGHHIQHWVDLGPTEVPNLVLLCRRHHRFVHEKCWQARIDEHGTVLITPPP